MEDLEGAKRAKNKRNELFEKIALLREWSRLPPVFNKGPRAEEIYVHNLF